MNGERQWVSLYCDCCGQERMAVVRDSKLIIRDRRHGAWHVLTIPLEKQGLTIPGLRVIGRADGITE